MLAKRIIPCLDVKDGRTVKGVAFEGLKDAGDPLELAAFYTAAGADELVLLDISATIEKRKTFTRIISGIADVINIPFTVGGGVSSVKDVEALLHAGADKISLNSAAVNDPWLIRSLAANFGSQCVVIAIDAGYFMDDSYVFVEGGRRRTGLKTLEWARMAEELGAGEILLTSLNRDGTKKGFDLQLTEKLSELLRIPVIASGGAGSMSDFEQVFCCGKADAALAASVFHFGEIKISELKDYLSMKNIPIRK